MPLVFVHGVSNRDTAEYRDNQLARNAFLRAFIAPALGINSDESRVFNPYWGDEGVKFRWRNASLPEEASEIESFGVLSMQDLRIAADVLSAMNTDSVDIVEIANRSLAEAIDVVWATALPTITTEAQAKSLAESYRQASRYAVSTPKPHWLSTAKNGNFVDQLLLDLEETDASATTLREEAQTQWESFGSLGLADRLREGLGRITSLPASVLSTGVITLGRRSTHLGASMFLGDVFQYLKNRGTRDEPGPIIQNVLEGFQAALSARTDDDSKLVVIGHSLGGIVAYDILTHFAPDLKLDALVTVGSQVALFEEMALFRASQPDFIPDPQTDRITRPVNVKCWLNVFDFNDVFSFRAEGVFKGVKDFKYDTGYGAMHAHSGYFRRPSFYNRLAERLSLEIV